MSIAQQLTTLVNQKTALAQNLVAKGVEANPNESFDVLIPKVLDTTKVWNDFILSNFGYGWGRRLFEQFSYDLGTPYGIKNLPPLDTSDITNFSGVFVDCATLTEAPPMDTTNGTNFSQMFYYSGLQEFPNYDFSNALSLDYAFANTNITTVPESNTEKCTGFYNTFENCTSLVTVEGINFSSVTTNLSPFNYCYALENLTIEGTIQADFYLAECQALTRDSLLSVIDALKDTTSTKYLTLSSTAEARLTNEDIAIAVNKGWTIEVQ